MSSMVGLSQNPHGTLQFLRNAGEFHDSMEIYLSVLFLFVPYLDPLFPQTFPLLLDLTTTTNTHI